MATRKELNSKTKEELYNEAQDRDVEGRSEMSKSELVDALASDEGQETASPQQEPLSEEEQRERAAGLTSNTDAEELQSDEENVGTHPGRTFNPQ